MLTKQTDREACYFCLTSHPFFPEQWEAGARNTKKAFCEGGADNRDISLAIPYILWHVHDYLHAGDSLRRVDTFKVNSYSKVLQNVRSTSQANCTRRKHALTLQWVWIRPCSASNWCRIEAEVLKIIINKVVLQSLERIFLMKTLPSSSWTSFFFFLRYNLNMRENYTGLLKCSALAWELVRNS